VISCPSIAEWTRTIAVAGALARRLIDLLDLVQMRAVW